jgi:hypothetical protein
MVSRGDLQHKAAKGKKKVKLSLYMSYSLAGEVEV